MQCLKWKRTHAGFIDAIFLYLCRLFKDAKAEAERRLAEFDAADGEEDGQTAILKTVEADDLEDDDS